MLNFSLVPKFYLGMVNYLNAPKQSLGARENSVFGGARG